MHRQHSPATVAAPFSRYSHGVETQNAQNWLLISGQVGVDPDGQLAVGATAQMEQIWRNIFAVLAAAKMNAHNIVKVTAFLTRREDLAEFREVRDRMMRDARPASTLVFVSGLADPDWLVEIEAIAAK
jgi:enamine deaminase RidA (YjgF/YER057c/UK114 family)